jgi:RNA 2',3'-cyclic 3'-phosphodiesterase
MSRARDSTARLFVAIDPPPDTCERLAAWARQVIRELGLRRGDSSPVRLLDPELMHVTLCFLGERSIVEIEPIGEALGQCAVAVGELRTGAPLWLPPRRPRTLAVEVHDVSGDPGGGARTEDADGGLRALQSEVSHALARVSDYREEHRRFRAHVTLARIRDGRGRAHLAGHSLPATPALSFIPEELVLYRSHLSPQGASYQALASHTLVPT